MLLNPFIPPKFSTNERFCHFLVGLVALLTVLQADTLVEFSMV